MIHILPDLMPIFILSCNDMDIFKILSPSSIHECCISHATRESTFIIKHCLYFSRNMFNPFSCQLRRTSHRIKKRWFHSLKHVEEKAFKGKPKGLIPLINEYYITFFNKYIWTFFRLNASVIRETQHVSSLIEQRWSRSL